MALIVSDRRTLIVGLGATGLSCVRHCHALGRQLAVADSRAQPPGLAEVRENWPEVDVVTGAFDPEWFGSFDELIVSPGVSLDEPAITAAAEAGVRISGDLDLFREAVDAPLVAITGSNGKSTVTTLLGEMVAEAGVNAAVGGNLGTPALDLVAPDVALYILEVSSFQLERTTDLKAEVATVLNVSDDHMDRYPDRMSYFQAKHRIFQGARNAVVNLDDPLSQPLLNEGMVPHFFGLFRVDLGVFSTREDETGLWLTQGLANLMHARELGVAGMHNIANVLAALALGHAAGLAMAPMLAAARRFRGLAHRSQTIRQHDGVLWVNDSKATNVGATQAAIESLAPSDGELVLIAGGDAKGADLSPLVSAIAGRVRHLVLMGQDAPALEEALGAGAASTRVSTMEEAVTVAAGKARPGDRVLLSPACSSLDQYSGYEARGEAFVRAVEAL
ncbi:UDP-N-acetylmuramoyl-L-alanine--D-glutamate ligase [Salicola sp. Rm-C-2C1-2]|uniref:UDP-N-acetylmuramoyl-L-alanine--D-glutamate ligase n=1 Tax=Salicola sp. Rm-C-2C1-2 TaxID=3141321 RepID=UPI0032E3AD28